MSSRKALQESDVKLKNELHSDVLHVLSNHPDGVEKNNLWNIVTSETGRKVSAKRFKVQKMNDILREWGDTIEEYGDLTNPLVRLRQKHGDYGELKRKKPPDLNDTDDFPPIVEFRESYLTTFDGSNSKKTLSDKAYNKQNQRAESYPHKEITSTASAPPVDEKVRERGFETPRKAQLSKPTNFVDEEVKKSIVQVFNMIGPSMSITLGALWKHVCDQLGPTCMLSLDELKVQLETLRDMLMIDMPGGPAQEETYRLRKQYLTEVQVQTSSQMKISAEKNVTDADEQVKKDNFKKEFASFLRSLLHHYPDGCSVNVVVQNIELRNRFPSIAVMKLPDIMRLLGNLQGVWFDGSVCFLAVDPGVVKRVQLLTVYMMLNGNVKNVSVPVLASSLKIADNSLTNLSNSQLFHILETTCIPKFLYRIGETFYIQDGVTPQTCTVDLENGLLKLNPSKEEQKHNGDQGENIMGKHEKVSNGNSNHSVQKQRESHSVQLPSVNAIGRSIGPTPNSNPMHEQLYARHALSPRTAMDCTQTKISAFHGTQATDKKEISHPGSNFIKEVTDLQVRPVVQKQFEKKEIVLQPFYVPRNQKPSQQIIEIVAKECIDSLADANEYVSPERVEQMLCQRFSVPTTRQLLPNRGSIQCIYDMTRLISKINAYIDAFVKTRSICTMYDLRECLREFVPNKEEFSNLKLGPLQRFPVVWEQFRFPPDQEMIPQITSSDIVEHFENYLKKTNKWSARLELEDFMNYLVETYAAENAYYLGVRIRSLPLAVQVLKKAKRDASRCHRETIEHFKENVRTGIEDAFRKFRAILLEAGQEGLHIRKHYLKLRPEIAIAEIFEKFHLLMTLDQPEDRAERRRHDRIRTAVQSFLDVVKQDPLAKTLLHLAICITNTVLEESAMDIFVRGNKEEDSEHARQAQSNPPPRKGHLVEAFQKCVERHLNIGALSLNHLDHIERKLLEEFGFNDFHDMGHGRFLEFIVHEAKPILENNGGLTLGSSSNGTDGEHRIKPSQGELSEFIKQSNQCGILKPDQLENAVCHQYGVKDVKILGHGNINHLVSRAEKHKQQHHVCYEVAYVAKAGLPAVGVSKVGMLGHQTKEAAMICLHNCPLLDDLAEYSQWSLVFEPEYGKLKDFIQKHGGVTMINIEGGRIAEVDMVALESKAGALMKIAGNTSVDHFKDGLNVRDVSTTCGHLVSLLVSSKGIENMPLALLSGYMKTALIQMHAEDELSETPGGPPLVQLGGSKAVDFVLQCLIKLPTRICVALANKVLLNPLGQTVGFTKSKQLLLKSCSSVHDKNHLFKLGCLLGINEWTNDISSKCSMPENAIHRLPLDLEEIFEEEHDKDDNSDSDMEDLEISLSDSEQEAEVPNKMIIDEDDEKDIREHSETIISKREAKSDISEDMAEDTTKLMDLDDVEGPDLPGNIDKIPESEAEEADVCRRIVEEIRKEEFGIGIVLSADGQRLMKVQQERLGRSIDRLSKDLYSKDTHFVLELIQNADDNSYHEDLLDESTENCPSVKFVIDRSKIAILNNEEGFREQNIRFLCDVGRSTKGKHKYGYIGQKGIGFKSVFRVTDKPEVHSNGYHIKFDVKSGPMGYILPHWMDQEPDIEEEWMTRIILPLKEEMRMQKCTLAGRFHDIHPSLLLFLHRLRKITIENQVEQVEETMRRYDLGDGIVMIKHTNGTDRWLVVRKMLDASKISLQAKSGVEVESTELALAFPLKPQEQKTFSQVMPLKQKVFAFLPLRSYGFRFIVQGDFDVPSSREDVDRDSSWNQWLRDEIHTLFIEALEVFKGHSDFTDMEAVTAFLQFVPMEDEILDFFKPVASQILSKLKARPCIPTQPNSQGVVSWKMPSQMVRVRDPLVREVITPDLLQQHLNLFYLHGDAAAILNPALTDCLGFDSLTSEHLFQIGKAMIISKMGDQCNDNDVITISRWLACMYRSLDEFQYTETILNSLKAFRMLPLSNGKLVSLNENTVFFPIMENTERLRNKGPLFYLQEDVNSLHPLLLQTTDSEVNSQVQKLLSRLGLKKLSPVDIINHHILPIFKSGNLQLKRREVVISYLIYIKEQTDKKPSLCNIDELRDVVQVMTSKGMKNPSKEPVHFTCYYGNKIDLPKTFPGFDWVLLDKSYIYDAQNPLIIRSWHDFFVKLGVEDFISIQHKEEQLTKESIEHSSWRLLQKDWPQSSTYIVKDYYSPELDDLIKHANNENIQSVDQMRKLCTILGQMWEGRFKHFCTTQVLDKDRNALCETETSFSMLLQTAAWLPAMRITSMPESNGRVRQQKEIVLMKPSVLFIRSEAIENVLSHKVLYVDVSTDSTMNTFYEFLGLKNAVTSENMKSYLLDWCSRGNTEEPATFCTSLQHMKNVYLYLCNNVTRQELQGLFRENPVYFVPERGTRNVSHNESDEVCGKMLIRNELWLKDPTKLFDKYRHVLKDVHSDICQKETIHSYYREQTDIIELFKHCGKIDIVPKADEYLELLKVLCETGTPKDNEMFSDVLCIFTAIGRAMVTTPAGMPDESTAQMALDTLHQTVKKKLEKQKVFPTAQHIWVSLEDQPMIADSAEWTEMFKAKSGVHFLDLKDRSKPHPRQSTKRLIKQVPEYAKMQFHMMTLPDVLGQESQIQHEYINTVLDVCNVKKISDCVNVTATPELIEHCPKLQQYIHDIIQVVQKFLVVEYNEVYQKLVTTNVKTALADAKFYQAKRLEVAYNLSNLKEHTFEIRTENCVFTPPIFYIQRDHVDSTTDINDKIAHYFSGSDTRCYASLRFLKENKYTFDMVLTDNNFKHPGQFHVQTQRAQTKGERSFLIELTSIHSNTAGDSITQLLCRYHADKLEIPKEELWLVEPPVFPVLVPELYPQSEEQLEAMESEAVSESQQKADDTEFKLVSWPPMPNPKRVQQKKDIPESNIWPPPRAKDYMLSVKDLPSNIKVAEVSRQEKGNDGSRTNDNTTDEAEVQNRDSDIIRKRKLPERQSSEQMVKRQISRNEQLGHGVPEKGKLETLAVNIEESDVTKLDTSEQGREEAIVDTTDKLSRENKDSEQSSKKVEDGSTVEIHRISATENRRTDYTHSSYSISDSRRQAPLSIHMADPVWTHLTSDYTYDELGSGSDLLSPLDFTQSDDTGLLEVGNWGEHLVYQYLLAKKESRMISDVIWLNQEEEQGKPYDFEVIFANEAETITHYIEVKSTLSESKEVFPISVQQIKFATEKKENFHIYRVFNAGNPEKVRLIRIHDLYLRMTQKQVKLCMLI